MNASLFFLYKKYTVKYRPESVVPRARYRCSSLYLPFSINLYLGSLRKTCLTSVSVTLCFHISLSSISGIIIKSIISKYSYPSRHAEICSLFRSGNSWIIFSTVSPAARYPWIKLTGILVPLIRGFPRSTSGVLSIYSLQFICRVSFDCLNGIIPDMKTAFHINAGINTVVKL